MQFNYWWFWNCIVVFLIIRKKKMKENNGRYFIFGGRGREEVVKGCFLSIFSPLSSLYVINILKVWFIRSKVKKYRAKQHQNIGNEEPGCYGNHKFQLFFYTSHSISSSFLNCQKEKKGNSGVHRGIELPVLRERKWEANPGKQSILYVCS